MVEIEPDMNKAIFEVFGTVQKDKAIFEVFGTVQKGLDLFWGGGMGMRVEVVLGWGSGTTISKNMCYLPGGYKFKISGVRLLIGSL